MLLPDDEIMSAIHRHERHYCHTGEKTPYLKRFLNDDEMTVTDHAARAPS